MARQRPGRDPASTPQAGAYVGMLALTALSMAVGCTLLALETSSDYEWDSAPKAAAVSIPTVPPALSRTAPPAAPADGMTAAPEVAPVAPPVKAVAPPVLPPITVPASAVVAPPALPPIR